MKKENLKKRQSSGDHLVVMTVANTAGALAMAPAATIQYLLVIEVTEATISRQLVLVIVQLEGWRLRQHLFLLINKQQSAGGDA